MSDLMGRKLLPAATPQVQPARIRKTKKNTSSAGNTVTMTSPGNQAGTVGTAIAGLQIHAADSTAEQTLTYPVTGLPTGLSVSSSGLP